VPARRLLALADDLLDLLPHALQGDAQRFQCFGRDTLTLVDETQEDVFGADVVVVEHPGLFLGQDDHPPRAVGEPLEHAHSLTAASASLPAVGRTALTCDGISTLRPL
jgi:hypothetical protein